MVKKCLQKLTLKKKQIKPQYLCVVDRSMIKKDLFLSNLNNHI